jgi:hypothetical protein
MSRERVTFRISIYVMTPTGAKYVCWLRAENVVEATDFAVRAGYVQRTDAVFARVSSEGMRVET